MLTLKKIVLYSVLLITLNLQGQIFSDKDTIQIKEVVIAGKPLERVFSASGTAVIDSSIISDYNHQTLADLISDNSTIYIKSYGPGGIASPSFRGTPAGHTLIAWNNININNPMPGQFDLSLVPAGFIDEVKIFYGSSSMEVRNGGFGGIINLETKPEWDKNNYLLINPGAGSFGRYSGLVKFKTGNNRFQSFTKAFIQSSENNFRFLNTAKSPVPEWERRQNSKVMQKGFIQELYLKNTKNSVLSGRFWYQSADRSLAVPITVEPLSSSEKQYDESFRSMLDFETSRHNTNFKITAAFLYDKLNYLNESASVDSRNKSRDIIVKTEITTPLGPKTRITIDLAEEVNFIKSNNYLQKCLRNTTTAGIRSETILNNWLVAGILLRETIADEKILVPDFSVSADFRPFPEKDYFAKLNFSKNSRIPTLNDMYWSPGGNPDLRNENAFLSEISWEMTEDISSSLKIKSEFAFFKSFINDLIQWHPGESSFWIADNLKKIETSGFEPGLSLIYNTSGLKVLLKAGYAFTKAISSDSENTNNSSDGKQIIYVPVNKLNTNLKLKWEHFYSGFSTYLVSRRFLTADNTQYLPGYTFSDLDFGMTLNSNKSSWDINFSVDNLFNISYQNVAWYPMPGRSYSLSVIFILSR